MAESSPTVSELFKAKVVTDDQVEAAVAAFLGGPPGEPHVIAQGYRIDLAAAVADHGWASQVAANPEASPGLKRAAVRTAILLARPEKA